MVSDLTPRLAVSGLDLHRLTVYYKKDDVLMRDYLRSHMCQLRDSSEAVESIISSAP